MWTSVPSKQTWSWFLIMYFVGICVYVQSNIEQGENDNIVKKWSVGRDIYEHPMERIVSGAEAPKKSFPYYAFLYVNSSGICGGSIIHKRWILTAAHCIISATSITVIVGIGSQKKSEWQVFKKTEGFIHPQYRYLPHDIGLVKLLTTDITFNDFAQPIALPRNNFKVLDYPLIISGLGRLSAKTEKLPSKIQYLCTHTVSHNECKKIYPTRSNEGIICSASDGKGTCNGDSGGPVVADNVVIGIVANTVEQCASKFPDIHTRVWQYMDWIKSHVTPWKIADPSSSKDRSCAIN